MSKKVRIFTKSKPKVSVVQTGDKDYEYVVVIEDHGWAMTEL